MSTTDHSMHLYSVHHAVIFAIAVAQLSCLTHGTYLQNYLSYSLQI